MHPPAGSDDWFALLSEPLPVDEVRRWVTRPDCGAEVVFVGTARDHADGREGVVELVYEAYEEHVVSRFVAIAAEVRAAAPGIGRAAVLHRVGSLVVGDAAVVVAVSAPHRGEAFDAARLLIDRVKAEAPIWKRERWADGEAWGFTEDELRSGSPTRTAP